MPLGAYMIIEEVFAKRKEARSWEEYHPHELAEMLECALLHIITLEVQATHLTKRALDGACTSCKLELTPQCPIRTGNGCDLFQPRQ